jgi:hypothetical protein
MEIHPNQMQGELNVFQRISKGFLMILDHSLWLFIPAVPEGIV